MKNLNFENKCCRKINETGRYNIKERQKKLDLVASKPETLIVKISND